MKVSSTTTDKYSVIKIEVDQILGYEAKEFQDILVDTLEKGVKLIIVDISGVKYISSWGIGMLIHGLATTRNRGGEFRIAGIANQILQVFKKVKIDTVLNVYPSVDLAISEA